MRNSILVMVLMVLMVGCSDSSDKVIATTFAYTGVVSGQLYDTVFMSDVTYTITIEADGYTHGTIQFGSAVILEFEGTTTDTGYFTAVDKNRPRNDMGLKDVSPIVMDGQMLTTDGHVNGGSGHWYMDTTIGVWNTPAL